MKETGIIAQGWGVRAILDGRKTQTRRIMKSQPIGVRNSHSQDIEPGDRYVNLGQVFYAYESTGRNKAASGELTYKICKCPYGKVGDRLWVRETWRCTGGGDLRNIIYRAEGDSPMSFCGIDDGRVGILHVPKPHWEEWDRLVYKTNRGCNWRSPIHMYKWATRIWLEITGIRGNTN